MTNPIVITNQDILHQLKLSCKLPEIIEQITADHIVKAAAVENGIKVETEELQQAADKIRLANNLDSAAQTWQWLETNHLSLDDFEQITHSSLIFGKLAAHLFENKVEEYFFAHQLDYAGVIMYEVILEDEDLALELFYAIKEGEISFYEVAHQYIENIELRRACGYRGLVRRRDLLPELSAAIFTVQPPQLLKPIFTSRGIHLILVEEIIQPELDAQLRQQIVAYLFAEWLKQQTQQVTHQLQFDSNQQINSLYSV
ncbi:PpiC-type peptidyl-prolyl cis-trans isomerase [Anabaenopsis circularis NIES-21]|uniref:peptidylprolyl isomerase n=2 Tax=Nostocales TaxID=1161 RepID=A0A1Z4GEP2_9CYAN|nr:peptidylprolyl isomerase [Nostoc cycadae]BAY15939.1 PpiC-type peptidyl-prolyl cis-trans isomerase [Anabaenopsis circularis NIES-21]GBE95115.1 peptidyl-prolyl cis-trans isomerase [Nostoc cycadae WK-1]